MAFIYGDYATGRAELDTPVNLMVIGDTTMDNIRRCTSDFEAGAARRLHLTVMSPAELKRRIASGGQG